MRPVLSIVLVMLLVLRGLLGDAMAMGVAHEMAQPVHATADSEHGGHGARHDAASTQGCCDAQGDSHAAHQAGCGACGVCHSVPAVPAWVAAAATGAGHALRPAHGTPFTSAPAAQAIKPPIA